MRLPSRLAWLRLAALAGLLVSALLTAETLHPERPFCPVDEACAAARQSALGSILGVPTALAGLLAFAAFLALTFVPRARPALRPLAGAAAAVGLGLFLYQMLALDAYCPFCVVADAMGVALGVAAFLKGPVPAGPPRRAETAAWAAAAVLAIALPLAWPQGGRAGWSAIAPRGGGPNAAPRISLVEYLNPFCAHCRATHARLARVLEGVRTPVERERLYAWSGKAAPLWAKACVCAQDQGRGRDLERPFFRELLKAGSDRPAEVWAAAERAGLDVAALRACVERGGADERLGWVRQRVQAARIRGMPTVDVGARRLEGEQTEAELREALAAAEEDLAGRPR